MLKKYKLGFDIWGLILFLVIMIPTFIWVAIPAPNDVLRGESVTGVIDTLASVSQVIMVMTLCVVINKNRTRLKWTPYILLTICCCLLYFVGWIFYYNGIVNDAVILLLTIPPCMTFLFFALERKNFIAVIPNVIFMICHLMYAVANFII